MNLVEYCLMLFHFTKDIRCYEKQLLTNCRSHETQGPSGVRVVNCISSSKTDFCGHMWVNMATCHSHGLDRMEDIDNKVFFIQNPVSL